MENLIVMSLPEKFDSYYKAMRMLEEYKIPKLSLTIDGTHIRFEKAPRGIHNNLHIKQE